MELWHHLCAVSEKLGDQAEHHKLGHELDRHLIEHPHSLRDLLSQLTSWAKGHPGVILDALRHVRPVLHVQDICIATSYDAVTAILANHQDFGITYGPKMLRLTKGCNFFLGQDDDEVSGFTSRSLTGLLFRREDVQTLIPTQIEAIINSQLEKLSNKDDLITGFLRPSVARFACEHFGLREIEPSWLYNVTEILFEYLFIDLENDPEIASMAEQAGDELRDMLDAQITHSRPASEETVIARGQRLISSGLTDMTSTDLRNNLLGLLIGLVPTTPKAAAMALDWLTQDPASIEQLRNAALNDPEQFKAMVREGMRLNPINPGLLRKARQTAKIPYKGSYMEVPTGTVVFTATHAAMRDPHFIEKPLKLELNRPASAYLNDGYGLHACFGRYINLEHVTLLLRHVLVAGYDRANGAEGDLVFAGPFPARMTIIQS